jgi:hypothetical protein
MGIIKRDACFLGFHVGIAFQINQSYRMMVLGSKRK